jgi:prepilin-type N-terminal cleavage/methylation domain-containing protein
VADRGLSLLELLVVLIILSITAAIVAPNFSHVVELYNVRKAARQLLTDLQLAKMRAVAEGVDHRVNFVAGDAPRYTVERNSGGTWTTIDIVRNLADPANPYYARGIGMDTSATSLRVVFSPLGSVNPPASITFRSPTNQSKTVKVIFTGRIRIE